MKSGRTGRINRSIAELKERSQKQIIKTQKPELHPVELKVNKLVLL